jgi:iron complex transport system ATP-binding protein
MKDGGILTGETLGAVYGLPVTVERTASGRRVCLPSLAPQSTPTMTSEALTTA